MSSETPMLFAFDVDAPRILCDWNTLVLIPAAARACLHHLDIVFLEAGWCGLPYVINSLVSVS